MVMSKEYYFGHKARREDGCGVNSINRGLHYWNKNDRNDEIDTMLREYEY